MSPFRFPFLSRFVPSFLLFAKASGQLLAQVLDLIHHFGSASVDFLDLGCEFKLSLRYVGVYEYRYVVLLGDLVVIAQFLQLLFQLGRVLP